MKSLKPTYDYILSYVQLLKTDDTTEGVLVGFSKLVSYIASLIQVTGMQTATFKQNEYEILQSFDINILKDDVRDWFTETMEYANIIPTFAHNKYKQVIDDTELTVKKLNNPINMIMINNRQTQRLMIHLFKRMNNMCYIIVEPNKLFYQIALINKKLYNIPAIILNIDSDVYNINMSSTNWKYAELWEGSDPKNLERW